MKHVALICGGRSNEHEISCVSARGVLSAIDRSQYSPVLIGISESGKWFLLDEKDRKSTRLNSSHVSESRMPSSA